MLTPSDRELLKGMLIVWDDEEHFPPNDEGAFRHYGASLLVVFIHPNGSVTRREFDNRVDAFAWVQERRGEHDVLMMRDRRHDAPDFVTYDYFRGVFEGRRA